LYLPRIIQDFSYDGLTLRYRTLASPEWQTREVSEITGVKAWRVSGGLLTGYRLFFRDAPRAYLDLEVPNAELLVEQLEQEAPALNG
jgi:hypothetical protein